MPHIREKEHNYRLYCAKINVGRVVALLKRDVCCSRSDLIPTIMRIKSTTIYNYVIYQPLGDG